jgi:hypothetical protein
MKRFVLGFVFFAVPFGLLCGQVSAGDPPGDGSGASADLSSLSGGGQGDAAPLGANSGDQKDSHPSAVTKKGRGKKRTSKKNKKGKTTEGNKKTEELNSGTQTQDSGTPDSKESSALPNDDPQKTDGVTPPKEGEDKQ